MQPFYFAAHEFNSKLNLGFDPKEYSKFKYGSKNAARNFGFELSRSFIASNQFLEFIQNLNGRQVVVISAPYLFTPTSTKALVDYFLLYFNKKIISLHQNACELSQIYRKTSYSSDYGNMNQAERDAAISSDSFYIDYNFLKDKFVLFIDDIKITGAHERRIQSLVDKCPSNLNFDCGYLYFAALKSESDIEPQIESYLNTKFLTNGLLSIDNIIKNEEFQFNTRVVKYILQSPPDEFKFFIMYQSETFRRTLEYYSIGNNYHMDDCFKTNLSFLSNLQS